MSASLALPDFPTRDAFEVGSSLSERETDPTFEAEYSRGSPRRRLVIRFVGGAEPVWLKSVTVQLERILRLEDGWDSYGAKSVKSEAIAGMITLLARLGTDVVAPAVFPASDGGIQIEWNTPAGSLEMKFFGKDRMALFVEEPGRLELEEEGISQAMFISDFYQKIKHLVPRG